MHKFLSIADSPFTILFLLYLISAHSSQPLVNSSHVQREPDLVVPSDDESERSSIGSDSLSIIYKPCPSSIELSHVDVEVGANVDTDAIIEPEIEPDTFLHIEVIDLCGDDA